MSLTSLQQLIRKHSYPMQPVPSGQKQELKTLKGIQAVLVDVYGTLIISGSGDIVSGDSDGNHLLQQTAFANALRDSGWTVEANQYQAPQSLNRVPSQEESCSSASLNELPAAELPAAEYLATKCAASGVRLMHESILLEHERLRKQGVNYPEVEIRQIWRSVFNRLVDCGFRFKRKNPSLSSEGVDTGSSELDVGQLSDQDFETFALLYEMQVNPVWSMPGAAECMQQFFSRNISLGIISNAQFMTPELLKVLLLGNSTDWHFDPDLCFFSYQSGFAKPGIEMYRQAAQRLNQRGISANKVLYVGNDQLKDIWPAAEVGFRTALFAGDLRSLRLRPEQPHISSCRPDLILTHWHQLPSCLS